MHPLAPLRFFRSDPLILWGVLLFGMIEYGGMSLVTNRGVRSGHADTAAVALVFWLAFGAVTAPRHDPMRHPLDPPRHRGRAAAPVGG